MSVYDMQAKNWLRKAGIMLDIKYNGYVKGFPFDNKDVLEHNFYTVTFKRTIDWRDNNCKTYKPFSIPFYDSYKNWQDSKEPSEYDILTSLEKYQPEEDVWDFANEYGYTINSRDDFIRVSNIHHQCKVQWQQLNEMLDGDEKLLEGLRNIA